MQIGAVKGKGKKGQDVKGKSKGELIQAKKERDDAQTLAEKNKDWQCFCCQKKGHIKSDCRKGQREMQKAKESGKPFVDREQTAAITDDEITGAVIEGNPNVASSSHDNKFAVTESQSLGSHGCGWKRLVVLMIITSVQEPVSALQDNDVSWVQISSGCVPTDARSGGANHPWPRKSVDRCWHDLQD